MRAYATIPQCADALVKAHGNVTQAAKMIGCSRSGLSGRISRHATLKKARIEGTEKLLDLAESALWQLVRDKNLGAVCFALKCQGKGRGWIENPTVVMPDEGADRTLNIRLHMPKK